MNTTLSPQTQSPFAANMPQFNLKRRKNRRILKLAGVFLGFILVIFFGSKIFSNPADESTKQTLGQTIKEQNIDHNFSIPIKTKDGETIEESVKFQLISAELTDEIVLKGQKATAVNDRLFLILNIKLTNQSESTVRLDTRNYVRLSVAGSSDRLAPAIHNDPVEVQPISDQPTRLGFSINKTDLDLTLFVGEITGDKKEISLSFK